MTGKDKAAKKNTSMFGKRWILRFSYINCRRVEAV